MVLDPRVDRIRIVTVDRSGRSTARFESAPQSESLRQVVVLIPGKDSNYGDLIAALDRLHSQAPSPPHEIWIAAPM